MKNINNTISIVTPTYNSEKYLEETILSVITQKGDFIIEYIIVDNESSDNTKKIIEKYEALIANKNFPIQCERVDFRWICEKDGNMYEAINKGFAISKGDIMAYLNSDDVLMTGALQTAADIFRRYDDIDWITGFLTWLNESGALTKAINIFGYKQKYLQKGYYHYNYLHFVQAEGNFWTKKLWRLAGEKMSEQYKLAGDYELWIRFSHFCKLYTVHSCLCGYRKHDGQLTANPEKYEKELMQICRLDPSFTEKLWFFCYKLYKNLPDRVKYEINFFRLPYLKFDFKNNNWINNYGR